MKRSEMVKKLEKYMDDNELSWEWASDILMELEKAGMKPPSKSITFSCTREGREDLTRAMNSFMWEPEDD
jgi:hypothetical protein